jgi:two-component system response regulator FlrC
MAVANVELNILASDPQANDLVSLVQGGVSVLVTDDTRSFELRASQGFVSFLYVGADWGKVKESLRSTLGKFASKPNAVIYADDVELAHFLGLMGVPNIVTAAALWDLVTSGSFAAKFHDKAIPRLANKRALDADSSQTQNNSPEKRLVFGDPKSRALLALVERVAQVEVTTLLSGPSGVGKEVIAKVLHASSVRNERPFVALNCSAIPEQLVESTLFGHIKGSFTGASRDQKGLFEEADGGVLFLDEVGELPLGIQPKLLRAIQERKVSRVGSFKEYQFDVRLIAATNRDLNEMVINGSFREDLLYRLNTFHLTIPTLSERPQDIEQLAISFAESALVAGVSMGIDRGAIDLLIDHDWPGNVRELENVIARAKVLATSSVILPEHIYLGSISGFGDGRVGQSAIVSNEQFAPDEESTLSSHRDQAEFESINEALRHTSSKKEAAERLGISPRTLRHKLQKFKEMEDTRGGSGVNLAGA